MVDEIADRHDVVEPGLARIDAERLLDRYDDLDVVEAVGPEVGKASGLSEPIRIDAEHRHPPPQQAGPKRHDRDRPVTHHSRPGTSSSPEA